MTADILAGLETWFGLALRLYIALVLMWGAAAKMRQPDSFDAALAGYALLPDRVVTPAARMLPVIEGVLAIALLVPATARPAMIVAALLLLVFAGAVAINLLRGRREIDCGCGGFAAVGLHWGLALRNIVLAVLLVVTDAALPDEWLLTLGAVIAAISLVLLQQVEDLVRMLGQRAPAIARKG